MNTRAILALQAAATAVLLAVLFRGLDWHALRTLFAGLPVWFYATSLAVILGGQVLYAWRWRAIMSAAGAHAPFAAVLRQYFIGIFINNFLPSTVGGDAAKVYYLGRHYGYHVVTASVVLDRLIGIGLLAWLAAVMLWLQPHPDPIYAAARLALTLIAAATATVLVVGFYGTGGLPARIARLGPRAVHAAHHLQRFRLEMAAAVGSPVVWVKALLTVVAYSTLVTLVYRVFMSLQLDATPGFFMLMMAVASATVLSNVPVAINGLGLREQLHVLLLGPLGVPREVAVAISLLLFAHVLVASIIGGLLWARRPAVMRGTLAGSASATLPKEA